MKLDNRGFAITGILYGLLILFVFTVSSLLIVMTSKKNRLDVLIEEIEEEEGYNTCVYMSDESCQTMNLQINFPFIPQYTGKYIFTINGEECFSYLYANRNVSIDELKCYTKNDGNLSEKSFTSSDSVYLKQIYY